MKTTQLNRYRNLYSSIMKYEEVCRLSAVIIALLVCTEGALLTGGKIVGGRDATIGEFPYQVSLHSMFFQLDLGLHCGAAIIDEYHVLTAAHCAQYGHITARVFAGVNDRLDDDEPNRVTFDVAQIYAHEDYNNDTIWNDIAIMRIDGSFPTNSSVIKSIPIRKNVLEPPAVCTVTGWGSTNENSSKLAAVLKAVDVPLISQDECVESYSNWEYHVLPGMMCAGYEQGGRDACQGDSGGPLVCDGELSGIVSWGNGCAEPNYPGVYTNVALYYDWIEQTLAKSKNDSGLQ